jgi:hypothetical protein
MGYIGPSRGRPDSVVQTEIKLTHFSNIEASRTRSKKQESYMHKVPRSGMCMFVHIPSREGPDLPCASVMCGADTELCTSNEVI